MAEHWKSTPKYWCKHCSTYVRDTKFERTQHEATAKHQGNLKRFLRDLHRGNERQEREQQRAKDEVERLNRLVSQPSGISASHGSPTQSTKRTPAAPASAPIQVSIAERKRQMAQLAEMGIAVPDDFRGELAMAGEWQTVSQKVLEPADSASSEAPLNVGARKRKFEGQEEEEEAGEQVVKKGWGSITKTYPSSKDEDDAKLDALLGGTRLVKKEGHTSSPVPKAEDDSETELEMKLKEDANGSIDASVKTEGSRNDAAPATLPTEATQDDIPLDVVFKKRKPRSIRQK